jgi:hypothetical protein
VRLEVQCIALLKQFSDYPVALVIIDLSATFWQPLHHDMLPILCDRLPALRAELTAPTAEGLIATLRLSMQQEKFDLPPVAGAAEAQLLKRQGRPRPLVFP